MGLIAQDRVEGFCAGERGDPLSVNPYPLTSASSDTWIRGWRDGRIENYIQACENCGSREFPKRSDCDGCTNAVDEEFADELRAVVL